MGKYGKIAEFGIFPLPQNIYIATEARMLHLRTMAGHVFDCSHKDFDRAVLERLTPLIATAAEGYTAPQPLPKPMHRYSVKTNIDKGFALFDVYERNVILTTNCVAWDADLQEEAWEAFEMLYLQVCQQMQMVRVSKPPQKPAGIPWLVTTLIPSPMALNASGWLTDFEQSYALSLQRYAASKTQVSEPVLDRAADQG